jgi:predicted Rossmann fold nucleotide-binding protein DprA/Smf involved in DNA uptake
MARTGLSADSLGVALGLLEIRGLVSRQPGQNYARN